MQIDKLKILSVDGGGVKGILPIILLVELEKKLLKYNRKIIDCFDYFAGTSTGALLLSLLLTNKYSCQDILDIYLKELPNIFKSSFSKYLWSLGGWEAPEYSGTNLSTILNKYCTPLIKPLIIPTYNIDLGKPHIFITNMEDPKLLPQILRGATAAPTFFSPGRVEQYQYIDGGVVSNNPTMIGLIEACKYHGLVPL